MKYTFKQTLVSSLLLYGLLSLAAAWGAIPIDLRYHSMPLLAAESGSSFKTISTYTDFKHHQHIRMQQMYQGYPVWGANVIQHSPGATLLSVSAKQTHRNGLVYQGLSADLTSSKSVSASVSANQEDAAIRQVTKLYQAQNKNANTNIIKSQANRLVYVDKGNKAHWAYYVEFLAQKDNKLDQPVYILDADTYQVYQSWNNLHTINDSKEDERVDGGGYGARFKLYDGIANPSFSILRDASTAICYLKGFAGKLTLPMDSFAVYNGEGRDPIGVLTDLASLSLSQFDCKEKSLQHHGIYWNDTSTFFADNDAFYHTNVTNNMYLAWYKTVVVANYGAPDETNDSGLLPIPVYAHVNMSNAAWMGPFKLILLGEGDDAFAPFTSLDVVAHELAHGFTEQHANLVYNGQSGGLNEAFSDMSGAAASYFSTGETLWTIGASISKTGDTFRYMDNPRHDCVGKKPYEVIAGYQIRQCSIDHMKDYKDGSVEILGNTSTFVDVHFSSGIFNKAFYLMAQGWGGDKQGGTHKAFDVMVQANRGYWTPNTTFQDAACGVMEATHDYGYDESVVTKAMAAVGLDTTAC